MRIMSYEDIKKTERAWAAEVANDLNNSSDKYVVYRESRPITDIKNKMCIRDRSLLLPREGR